MRQRISETKPFLFSILFFCMIFFFFQSAADSLSHQTSEETQKNLEQALRRSIIRCYAMEGAYPESLSYLKEHYGLLYDESLYFVDYQPHGTNILPEITIIPKGGSNP